MRYFRCLLNFLGKFFDPRQQRESRFDRNEQQVFRQRRRSVDLQDFRTPGEGIRTQALVLCPPTCHDPVLPMKEIVLSGAVLAK